MTIYLLTIFILFNFSLFEIKGLATKKTSFIGYCFVYLLLVFQVGLRWETGTDWLPYLNNFSASESIDVVLFNTLIGYEIGYGFLAYLIRLFTENYTIFLLLHALIYYLLIFKANKQISPFPFVSLLLFYVSTIGILGSNRQLLALAICLFALQFVVAKKPIQFFSLVFLAFLFHTSALLFLVFYFLDKDFKKKYIIGVLVISIIVGATSLPNFLFSGLGNILGEASANKAEIYAEKGALGNFSLSLVGLIRRLIYFVVFFLFYDRLTVKYKEYKLIFNGFLFGLIFYFLFAGSLLILVNRGSIYFNVMEVYLLTSLLYIFNINKDRLVILLIIFVYSFYLFFQSISVYSDLFLPYKGIYINTEYKRDLY
jgi:hypothetical protein